jgi:transposase-like protein
MKTDYNSKSVAEAFMHNVVKLHGMPKSIVSDRDKVFTSAFWQHLFKLQGTTLAMTSAYHPQSDGQTKVLNK